MVAVYLNYLLLIRYFFTRKYLMYLGTALAGMLLAGFLQNLVSEPANINYKTFTQYSIPIYSVVIFTSIYFIIRQYINKVNEARLIQVAQMQGELRLLKAQLQPHFLFNTLNNIYGLTMEAPGLAGESILKLSGILRYIIYETSQDMVELSAEMAFVRQYVHLEKLRSGQRLSLSLNMATEGHGFFIPPMLLVTFLENAFKHAGTTQQADCWITIDLVVKDQLLHYTVENSTNSLQARHDQPHGVGLENLRRRLSLLYPEYQLRTIPHDDYFSSYLSVPSLTKKP